MKAVMRIGDVAVDNPVALSPMAGVTNSIFRRICKEMGAGLVVTEMVSCKGLFTTTSAAKSCWLSAGGAPHRVPAIWF